MTKLNESIITNYPKRYQANGISLTASRSGAITEVENYDEDEDYNNVSFFDKKNCFELQGSDEYLSTMIRARVRVVKKTIE